MRSGKSASVALTERPVELEGFGEHYDLKKYEECHRKEPLNSRCEIYRLKRQPAPEYWPHHKTSPVKWPETPREAVYRPGMTPVDYWRALCKAEAGEFIYRTVQNVDSIYQVRPRPKESSYAFTDRYVMEDPYGYVDAESGTLDNIPWIVVGPGKTSNKSIGRYPFFESPILTNDIHWTRQQKYYPAAIFRSPPPGAIYQRFFGFDRRDRKSMQLDFPVAPTSRFGWVWRAIHRPFDRWHGVSGGELAVVELATGSILALRRGFILGSQRLDSRVNWASGNVCPEYRETSDLGKARNRSKDFDFSFWFINEILIPLEHRAE